MAARGAGLRIEARVESLAPGGDGVAHVAIAGQRRAVFLPKTAPGDVVLAEVDPRARPARGRLLEVLTAGEARVVPACAWADRCGGCDWMHLTPAAQADAHADLVRAALPAAARALTVAVHAAPAALAYRTRARVHLRAERGSLRVGMHEARTHETVEVASCAVLDPALEVARARLARWFDGCRGRGEAQLALGVDRVPVLDVTWRGDVDAAVFARLETAVAEGAIAGAQVTLAGASRPAVVGDPEPWTVAADGRPLRLGPGGFGQANERVNALLGAHVAWLARESGAQKAVELYAGAGNLSVLLAALIGDLTTVETRRASCDAARANLASRGLRARVVEGDAETHAWPAATSLLVLDPPRAGARTIAARLARSRVAHVVYVSCDPPTLGRDLEELMAAYDVRSVATFEMFPQTSHVETVVALTRRPGAAGRRDGGPSPG